MMLANDRCGLGFALHYRKLATVDPFHNHHHIQHPRSRNPSHYSHSSDSRDAGEISADIDDTFMPRFEEELSMSPSTTRRILSESRRSNVVVSAGSTPTSEGFLARLAAAALSLPARLRTTTATADVPLDGTLEVCPVCSASFRKWDTDRMQKHVMDCIHRTESTGMVTGNRHTSYRWNALGDPRECSICFEDFEEGQRIAVLDCLCQFHEKCIDAWFERGKFCPFHVG